VVTVLQLSDLHVVADPDGIVHGRNPRHQLAVVLDAWRQRNERADVVVLTGG